MKRLHIIIWTLTALLLTTPTAYAAFNDPFISQQVGSSPVNGYVLQTNGTDSTWVDPSAFSAAAYPFPVTGNATSTLTQFLAGLTSYASTTIGGGTQASGLTISGGATTTGNAYIGGVATIKGNGSGFAQIGDNGFGTAIAINGSALSGTNYNFYSSPSDTRLLINRPSTKDLVFNENNTIQMILKGTTGNVGIGTTSPTYKLSVEGISSLGNRAIAGYFTATSTTASTFAGGITSSATTTAPYFAASSLGTAGAPAFTFTGDLNTGIYNIGADQLGLTAGGTLRAQVTANGLGIGAAPSTVSNTNTALVVQGTGSQENKIVMQSDSGTHAVIEAAKFGGATTQTAILRLSKQGGSIASPSSLAGNEIIGLIDFQVRNTGGLASPAQITANIPGSANNPNTPAYLNFLVSNGSDTSAKSALILTAGAASAVNYLQIANSATLAGPTISAQGSDTNINLNFTPKGTGSSVFTAGNVGIGTTSPWAKLSVEGISSLGNQAIAGYFTATSTVTASTFASRVGIASSSPAFPLSVNTTGTDFYVTSTGKVVGQDTTNSWGGRISPTRTLVIPFGTSTQTWTATGTPPLSVAPDTVAPFAGTVRQVRCKTNTFLGVVLSINGTPITPTYFVASSTVGKISATASNTFAAGDTFGLSVGTTTTATTASAISGSCSVDVTETP